MFIKIENIRFQEDDGGGNGGSGGSGGGEGGDGPSDGSSSSGDSSSFGSADATTTAPSNAADYTNVGAAGATSDPFVGRDVDPYTNTNAGSGTSDPFVGRGVDPYTNAAAGGSDPNVPAGAPNLISQTPGQDNNLLAEKPSRILASPDLLASNGPLPTNDVARDTSTIRYASTDVLRGQTLIDRVTIDGHDALHYRVTMDGATYDAYYTDRALANENEAVLLIPAPAPPVSIPTAQPVSTPTGAAQAAGIPRVYTPNAGETIQTLPTTVIEAPIPYEPKVSLPGVVETQQGIGRIEFGDLIQAAKGVVNGLHELLTAALPSPERRLRDAAHSPLLPIDPRYAGAAMIGSGIAQNIVFEGLPKAQALNVGGRLPVRAGSATRRAVGELPALGPELQSSLPTVGGQSATGFQDIAEEAATVFQDRVRQAEAHLRANPDLIMELGGTHTGSPLSFRQINAAARKPQFAKLLSGNAMEAMVNAINEAAPPSAGSFRQVGGAFRIDFEGIGAYDGLTFELTTEADVIGHSLRPYMQESGAMIFTYTLPLP